MDIGLISILVILSLLFLLFLGFPVAFCLLSVSIIFTVIFWSPRALGMVAASTFGVMVNSTYLAIPLFVFMAAVLQFSGVADELYETLWKWLGGIRGGLAIATAGAITLIDAMTGIGATGIVTMGMLAYPHMEKHHYHRSISVGPIPAASALGPLIPPSNIMIILGGYASISIGGLFMGGLIPGLLISSFIILYIAIRCIINPKMAEKIPVEDRASWVEKFAALRGVILPIFLVLLVLGGIYSGAATPIEASGVGAIGAIICAAVHRKVSLENLKDAVQRTIKINVMVLWLLIGGSTYSSFMSASGVGPYLGELLMGLPLPPIGILAILLVILLLMGMVMESVAIIMVTVPIFFPVIKTLGFNPLWFGVVFVIAIIIGYITPPLGYNLFYMRGVLPSDVSTRDIFRYVVPFIPIMVLVLILVVIFPQIILWLPNKMIK